MERIIKSHISAGRVARSDVIEPSPCCMCIRFFSHSFPLPTELTRIRYRSNYTEPSGDVVNRENLRQHSSYVSEKQSTNRVSLTTVYHVYDGWREKQASTEFRILHCSARDHGKYYITGFGIEKQMFWKTTVYTNSKLFLNIFFTQSYRSAFVRRRSEYYTFLFN